MEKDKNSFGTRLRKLRHYRGLTVAEVARSLGVATSTYREWEYGRSIRGEPYVKLAEILDATIYEILTGQRYTKNKALMEMDKIDFHIKSLRSELEKTV